MYDVTPARPRNGVCMRVSVYVYIYMLERYLGRKRSLWCRPGRARGRPQSPLSLALIRKTSFISAAGYTRINKREPFLTSYLSVKKLVPPMRIYIYVLIARN